MVARTGNHMKTYCSTSKSYAFLPMGKLNREIKLRRAMLLFSGENLKRELLIKFDRKSTNG